MAMTQQERDAKRKEKANRLHEEDLRLKVIPSTKASLASLMDWEGIDEQGEALTLLIHSVQGKGRFSVSRMTGFSLHRIEPSDFVERADLRLKAMPGTIRCLNALKEWLGVRCYGAVLDAIVEAAFIAGSSSARPLLRPPPREPYVISPAMALKIDKTCKPQAPIASA